MTNTKLTPLTPVELVRRLSMLEHLTQTAVEQACQRSKELKSISAMISAIANTELPDDERKSLFFGLERLADYCASEATMDSECLESRKSTRGRME